MSRQEEARRMRLVKKRLRDRAFEEIRIVVASSTSWMAQVVMIKGRDRRFRFQDDRLIDEATIGDARVA